MFGIRNTRQVSYEKIKVRIKKNKQKYFELEMDYTIDSMRASILSSIGQQMRGME